MKDIKGIPADAPMCASGSRPIRTEAEARSMLGQAKHLGSERESRQGSAVEGGVYPCKVCGWWHLSTSDKYGKKRGGSRPAKARGPRRRR